MVTVIREMKTTFVISHRQCGNAGFGLALHGLVQSDLGWCSPVQCLVHVFNTTSHY
jgi:hypothetical protein